jgi:hypothetical protein
LRYENVLFFKNMSVFILNVKENYKKFGLKTVTGNISVKCRCVSLDYFALRAYPKSPAALNVIHVHAKCSIAR